MWKEIINGWFVHYQCRTVMQPFIEFHLMSMTQNKILIFSSCYFWLNCCVLFHCVEYINICTCEYAINNHIMMCVCTTFLKKKKILRKLKVDSLFLLDPQHIMKIGKLFDGSNYLIIMHDVFVSICKMCFIFNQWMLILIKNCSMPNNYY